MLPKDHFRETKGTRIPDTCTTRKSKITRQGFMGGGVRDGVVGMTETEQLRSRYKPRKSPS